MQPKNEKLKIMMLCYDFFPLPFKIHAGDGGCTCHSSSGDGQTDRRTSSLMAGLLCLGLEFLYIYFFQSGGSQFSQQQHKKMILVYLDVHCFSFSSSILYSIIVLLCYVTSTDTSPVFWLNAAVCADVPVTTEAWLCFWTIENQEISADHGVRLDTSLS